MSKIDPQEINPALLGPMRPAVTKIPFQIDDIPYFDTTFMCDPMSHPAGRNRETDSDCDWDMPLQRNVNVSYQMLACSTQTQQPDYYSQYNMDPGNRESKVTFSQTSLKYDELYNFLPAVLSIFLFFLFEADRNSSEGLHQTDTTITVHLITDQSHTEQIFLLIMEQSRTDQANPHITGRSHIEQ